MKIILANIPWISNGCWGVRAGSRWPHIKGHTENNYLPFPFYLAYAAASLKKHDFNVTLIDAIALQMGYQEFLAQIKDISPDLIVCEVSTVSLEHDLNFLKQIGEKFPLALCGPDVNIRNPGFIAPYQFVRYVMVGEYENILLNLAQHLSEGGDLGGIPGLLYRDVDFAIKVNPGTQIIENLDALPWPMRENMLMERYIDSPGDLPLPMVQMWASRGCPFKCKFCLWPQVMYFGNHYRTRKVECVIDEMEYLVKKMGFKAIYFDDDTWNVGKDRILRFCREIKQRRLDMPWAIMARPDLMDEEILDNLKDAGLYSLKYGVESAAQTIINNIDKNMDLKKTDNMIRYTKKIDIKMHLTFTFGLDGETPDTIMETIKYALRLDPMSVQFSLATPFPGTKFYKDAKDLSHIVSNRLSNYDGNHNSVIQTDNLSVRDLTRAKKMAYRIWERHCLKRKSYKNTSLVRRSLLYKLISGLKSEGIMKTVVRTFSYFCRKFLAVRETIYFERQIKKSSIDRRINFDNLEIICWPGRIKVFWRGREITKDVGFTTSFKYAGGWYDSSRANWEIFKISDKKIDVAINFWELPMKQRWAIELLDGHNIDWNVSLMVTDKIMVSEQKAGIMLRGRYKKWIDSWGEGKFPKFVDWEEIMIRDKNSRYIGVRGDRHGWFRYPTVLLDFSKPMEIVLLPQVQNSSPELTARLIQARNLQQTAYEPGREYEFFNGLVKLWQEK